MNSSAAWYATLIKPSFAPPASWFGPVWTVLYVIIAITFGYVFFKAFQKKIPLSIAIPFALNIVFNLAFTPLQFGLKINLLAAVDILLVLGSLLWSMKSIWPHHRRVAIANIPYLLWVCFATVLQLSVTWLNW